MPVSGLWVIGLATAISGLLFVAFVNLDVGYTAPSASTTHSPAPVPSAAPAPVPAAAESTDVRRVNVLDKVHYNFPPEMLQNMDLSKNPCDNFYEFSCAGFEARTVLPDWTPSWALAWDNVGNKTRLELVKLLETSKDDAGQWYRACMNIPTTQDFVLVEAHLTAIQSVGSMPELFHAIGLINRIGTSVFFDWSVQNDEKNPSSRILSMSEGGISLPDKDYYLQADKSAVNMLHNVIVEIMNLAGYAEADATAIATDAVAVETHLASHMWSNTQSRVAKPQRYSLAQFQSVTPGFDWVHIFDTIVAKMMQVNSNTVLHNPLTSGRLFEVDNLHGFFAGMNKIITADQLPRLKHYMLWRVLKDFALHLDVRYEKALHRLALVLSGKTSILPRWMKCKSSVVAALPTAMSKMYMKHLITDVTRNAASEMIAGIRMEFNEALGQEPWMDAKTRHLAQEKLAKALIALGGPPLDSPTPASESFPITSSYTYNYILASEAEVYAAVKRLGETVQRLDWNGNTATDINSYYNRAVNVLFIPAGILQPPFFDPHAALAVNLGAAGVIFGHEFTHGFDDIGSQYDINCRRQSWWPHSVEKEFNHRSSCVAKHYASYVVAGVHVKGNLTLAEDLADTGGLRLAWSALSRAHRGSVDKQTAQLFFESFAQVWCSKTGEKSQRLSVRTDQHAPSRVRVNAGLSNMPEFAEAFSCPVGSPMNPAHKCSVW